MSESQDYISQVQSSNIENDIDNEEKNDLVSDLQEANDILSYFKREYSQSDPERYQELLTEHEELRITTIEAVKSENLITTNELDSIKKEFEDVENLEGYWSWLNRQRLEAASSLANSAYDFFNEWSLNYYDTENQIDSSNMNEYKKNKVNTILKDSYNILSLSVWQKNFNDVKSVYLTLDDTITESLNEENTLNLETIHKIQDIYSVILWYKVDVSINKLEILNKQKTPNLLIEKNEIQLRKINISESSNYTIDQAKQLLSILNRDFSEYEKSTITFGGNDSINELNWHDKEDIKEFQKRLIEKIIWNNKGSLDSYMWFNKEKWYFLWNVEIAIKEIKEIWLKTIDDDEKVMFIKHLYKKNSNDRYLLKENLINIFWEKETEDLIIIAEDKNIIEKDWNFISNKINSFNESLDINILRNISRILPEELCKILDETTDNEINKYKILFKISQYIYSLSDSPWVEKLWLRWNFFEEAHNKSTENILKKVLIEGKQVVSYDPVIWYDIKKSTIFEKDVRNIWAENMDKLEIASYLWNLDPSATPEQLVNTLGQDNLLYIMLLFKSWNISEWFATVKKVFWSNFNENNIESFAWEYLSSKFFQWVDWWELLNNNINKLSPLQGNTLVNIVKNNSNICIKCEWGNFENKITNEILSISKQREIDNIYEQKQQEFNEKIVTEFLEKSWLEKLPLELQEELTLLGSEIFNESKEVLQKEWCAFELIAFVNNHENIWKIEILLEKYWLNIQDFHKLTQKLTSTVASAEASVNIKKLEFNQNDLVKAEKIAKENPWNIELQENLAQIKTETILLQKKVSELKRVEKIIQIATIDDTTEIVNMVNNWNSREDIFNYLVENSENSEAYKVIILEYKSEIKSIDEGLQEKKLDNLNNLDKQEPDSPIYQNFIIDNNWEWSFINSSTTWEKIKITSDEADLVENNPEGLKNLVDMKEKLDELNLWFMWTFRQELISLSWEILWTNWINSIDRNFINKTELNKLLNLVLNIAWFKWTPGSISWTYSKIIAINWVWAISNKKDTIKWLSNIWMKLASDDVWFINNDKSLNVNWKANVLKNYKK